MKVNLWERFLDSLSTEGGHIFVWFLTLWAGLIFEKCGIPFGHEISVASLTGLSIAIKNAARSNKTRQERTTGDSTNSEG